MHASPASASVAASGIKAICVMNFAAGMGEKTATGATGNET